MAPEDGDRFEQDELKCLMKKYASRLMFGFSPQVLDNGVRKGADSLRSPSPADYLDYAEVTAGKASVECLARICGDEAHSYEGSHTNDGANVSPS